MEEEKGDGKSGTRGGAGGDRQSHRHDYSTRDAADRPLRLFSFSDLRYGKPLDSYLVEKVSIKSLSKQKKAPLFIGKSVYLLCVNSLPGVDLLVSLKSST